ncbi:haloacid dehalogenase type II [Tunturiibacter lichenicola]|uniref:haloacid dehalogenase type II n=1 Tax=Tunturiibacter lichenicola TaxID=2051959 RepID=UPI0021B35E7B|nr:haloacid dehalogenase type II [Edaphobacter lichenicola]
MKRIGANRRQFLGAATMLAASALAPRVLSAQNRSVIKAVAFDAFAIFDSRPVFDLAEELFPRHGAQLSNEWRTRQFEYTWLRNSMHKYADFWNVTQDALNYAAKQSKVSLGPEQNKQLMSAFLQLKPWPDVAAALQTLQKRGIRMALLSNMTDTMMKACVEGSNLGTMFEFQLSTDRVKIFKPDPVTYNLALEAFHLQKHQIAFVAFGGWDAVGAQIFGYSTYWVNRLNVPSEELGVSADATSHDLSSLPSFLDSLQKA